MRMALLTAQKMGDDLLAEAKEKSNSLLSQTDFEAKKKMEQLRYEIEAEEARLKAAKEKTAEFVKSFRDLVSSHSEFLSNLDNMVIPAAAAAVSYTHLGSRWTRPAPPNPGSLPCRIQFCR